MKGRSPVLLCALCGSVVKVSPLAKSRHVAREGAPSNLAPGFQARGLRCANRNAAAKAAATNARWSDRLRGRTLHTLLNPAQSAGLRLDSAPSRATCRSGQVGRLSQQSHREHRGGRRENQPDYLIVRTAPPLSQGSPQTPPIPPATRAA